VKPKRKGFFSGDTPAPFTASFTAAGANASTRLPFLWLSVLVHVGLLAAAYHAAPVEVKPRTAVDQQRIDASLDKARRIQMQRHVRKLDDIARELQQQAGGAAGPPQGAAANTAAPADPQALLEQAQALAQRIEQAEQKLRADELARLLKLPADKALAQVVAEAAQRPQPPLPAQPEAAIAELERRARALQTGQQQRQAEREQGVPVAMSSGPGTPAADGERSGGAVSDQSASQASSRNRNEGSGQGSGPTAAQGSGPVAGSGSGTAAGATQSDASLQGGALESATGAFRAARSYSALRPAPAPDGATLRLAAGRSLGSGGAATTRLFLDSWYIAGPFEARGASDLQRSYPPEQAVDLDAAYDGKGGRLLQWQYQTSPRYPVVPEPRVENAIYYAYTEIHVDQAQTVWLEIGADDDSKLWLNDTLVWESGGEDKPWYRQPFYNMGREISQFNLVEGARQVRLQAGANTLLFKLYNGIDLMFFSVVISR